jgi:hypothetical protein
MIVSLVVGGAGLTFMAFTFRQADDISSRTAATDRAEQGLEQLVRDLREAMTNVSISGGTISFSIPKPGTAGVSSEPVAWTCPTSGVGNCTRAVPSGTPVIEITGVQSVTFSPYNTSNPPTAMTLPITNSTGVSAVGIKLTVQNSDYGLTSHGTVTTAVRGNVNPIVLEATADLRNFG